MRPILMMFKMITMNPMVHMKIILMNSRIAICMFGALLMTIVSCNRDERLMNRMEGNWTIKSSVITYFNPDGSEQVVENLNNPGRLVISDGNTELEKNYDFFYINSQLDTFQAKDVMVTDEYRNRMVMMNALVDSTGSRPIVWTITKRKRNKQIWSTYGVDSTLFYPANNMNPGAASNWVSWEIELKRDD